jgi:hypothetical protein
LLDERAIVLSFNWMKKMGSGLKEWADWRVWQAGFSLVKAGEIF